MFIVLIGFLVFIALTGLTCTQQTQATLFPYEGYGYGKMDSTS